MRTRTRILLLAAAGYAAAAASLRPSAADVMDPQWHREMPGRLMMRGMARLLPALYARRGEPGVKALQSVFYQVGVDRAPLLARWLDIDVTDARSLGRVLDYEDGLVGVRGTWTEECRGRAVKEERYCPVSRELERCPEVCTSLFMAMEAGTFSVLNPDLAVPEITKLLSRGDDCCLAVLEVPGAGGRAAEVSAQATPGQFPPVIRVPGLQARLLAAAVGSLAKVLMRIAGGEEPPAMQWYEFFRYEPPGGTSSAIR